MFGFSRGAVLGPLVALLCEVIEVVTGVGAADTGVFGLDMAPAGGGQLLFETTQGAGGLFSTRQFDITTAGRYEVTLTDVESKAGTYAMTVAAAPVSPPPDPGPPPQNKSGGGGVLDWPELMVPCCRRGVDQLAAA